MADHKLKGLIPDSYLMYGKILLGVRIIEDPFMGPLLWMFIWWIKPSRTMKSRAMPVVGFQTYEEAKVWLKRMQILIILLYQQFSTENSGLSRFFWGMLYHNTAGICNHHLPLGSWEQRFRFLSWQDSRRHKGKTSQKTQPGWSSVKFLPLRPIEFFSGYLVTNLYKAEYDFVKDLNHENQRLNRLAFVILLLITSIWIYVEVAIEFSKYT